MCTAVMRRGNGMRINRGGFTLVEVLVAVAVLAMLVLLVAQMVNGAMRITSGGRKLMDADDEARLAFEMMGADISRIAKFPGIEPSFSNNVAGNDSFYFFTTAPGYFSGPSAQRSDTTLVGYRITSHGLERYAKALAWDDIDYSISSTAVLSDSNCHVIAPSVFRMEYALLMKPGSINGTNGANSQAVTNGINSYSKTNNAGQGLRDVSAVVVAIAVLDPTSRKTVSPLAMETMAADIGHFPDFNTNGTYTNLPVAEWTKNIPHININPAARSQIRIYQHIFPVSP